MIYSLYPLLKVVSGISLHPSLLEVQKKTQNLLDQQQRLALQDKKILEEYKSEIKELKSLNVPKQGSEKDDSIPKENSVENIVKEPQNKKWWHFGRRM